MSAPLLSDKNQDALEDLIVGIEANGANLGIFIAVCDDISLRTQLIEQYETALSAEFCPHRLVLDPEEPSLSALIRHQIQIDERLSVGKPAAISILGTESLSALRLTDERSPQEIFYGYLQWTRESLRAFPFAIVLWVSYQMLETLSRKAPDFWSWRRDVIRFESKKKTAVQLDRFLSQSAAAFLPPEGVLNSIPIADLEAWIGDIETKTPDSPLLADLHTQAGELYANRLMQGNCLNYKAELEAGIRHLERGIQQQSKTVHSEVQIDRVILLGQLAALKQDPEKSQQLWQQALAKADSTEELSIQANARLKIANKARDLGDIQTAQTLFDQALALYDSLGDKQQIATTLNEMGLLTHQLGETEKALSLWEKALSLQEEIEDKAGKAESLDNMAYVVAQRGDVEKAIALWQTALALHEQINEPKYKASVLNNMASVIAQQGDIERALQLWQDSLDIKERIGDVKGKAATLSNMANVIAQQGDIERALQLWQEDLDTSERIGDVKGKAATLNNMAGVIAQQGDIERALQLWQDSLDILERIGDVKGKAATLSNMAYYAGERGDRTQQLTLNRQAAEALGQIRAYNDLLTVLNNLGRTAEEHNVQYLAQANWLMLRIQAPLTVTINLLSALYQSIPKGDPLEALLGSTASFFCQTRGENHPRQQQLQELSVKILLGAATEQGIDLDAENAFQNWMRDQQLNDPSLFLPKLNTHLTTLIGDSWAFDPTPLQK